MFQQIFCEPIWSTKQLEKLKVSELEQIAWKNWKFLTVELPFETPWLFFKFNHMSGVLKKNLK